MAAGDLVCGAERRVASSAGGLHCLEIKPGQRCWRKNEDLSVAS